jgi:hypothetical protein
MSTLIVKPSRPRNPLVAPARFRRAGKHGAPAGGARQADRRALKKEVSGLDLSRSVRGEPPGL